VQYLHLLPIAETTVIFILSLIGAIVLFKFLQSSALIQKAGYQAGGALAGFLLIFGILHYSMGSLSNSLNATRTPPWAITGTVRKASATKHDMVRIKQVPPVPFVFTNETGDFELGNVAVLPGSMPKIVVESEGYFPQTIDLKQEKFLKLYDVRIDSDAQKISLMNPILLDKIPP